MGSSIVLAIWFFVGILTQYFITKANAASDQVLTFLNPKTNHSPVEQSISHSCPDYKLFRVLLFRSRTEGKFHNIPRDGSNEKHNGGNEMNSDKITNTDRKLSRRGSSQ